MLIKTFAAAVYGIDAIPVTVEVSSDKGIGFTIVGLPDAAVKESRERVRAAIKNCGYKFPVSRITLNAPHSMKRNTVCLDTILW